ncbi:MAG: hypothetical protein GX331_01585 [Firmicutes bacterium]|nr:hypothetical protein [Bacillota bacterium]
MDKRTIAGILLIVLGLLIFAGQQGWVGEHFALYLIAVGFGVVYYYRGGNRHYSNVGFLIPAVMLLSIAFFVEIEQRFDLIFFGAGWFFLLTAFGFYAVYLLHTRTAGSDGVSQRWPLYPAVILAVFGLFIAFVASPKFGVVRYLFPVAIILVGIYLIVRKQE